MITKEDVVRVRQLATEDPRPSKVVLLTGIYTESGSPYFPPSVAEAEQVVVTDPEHHHGYIPCQGDVGFTRAATEFLLGRGSPAAGRAFAFQAPGGGGALFLGASYLSRVYGHRQVLLSEPGYVTHHSIFGSQGFSLGFFRYLDRKTKRLDIEGLVKDLRAAPPSVVVLQASGHNPTGIDPSPDEWCQIADAVRDAGHVPFFDCAYLGFVTGDSDADAAAVRSFVADGAGFPVVWAALSFSKNLGLYGQRVGALVCIANDAAFEAEATPELLKIVHSSWNRSPRHGSDIAKRVLAEEERLEKWRGEMERVVTRLDALRSDLHSRLIARDPSSDWSLLRRGRGMYAFFDLTPDQAEAMRAEGVYVWPNGRICLGSLVVGHVDRFVEALVSVVGKKKFAELSP